LAYSIYEKFQALISIFDFLTTVYTVDQRMGVGAGSRTKAVSFLNARTTPPLCGYSCGSGSDTIPWPILYSEKIQNIIFDFFTVKVKRIGVATRTLAA
jgi:hypothetical protein